MSWFCVAFSCWGLRRVRRAHRRRLQSLGARGAPYVSYVLTQKPGEDAGLLREMGLDAHVGEALHDIAQGTGDRWVADFEALYGQVDAVYQ